MVQPKLAASSVPEDALVSVVVLNYNNKELLEQSLASVLDQSWPKLEVIVVDNCSTDGSPEMVEQRFGDGRTEPGFRGSDGRLHSFDR